MPRTPFPGVLLLVVALGAGCLASPPPIVVVTPYGDVRAESEEKASEVAELLELLAPRVREVLPGCQSRRVDVWVQEELKVYRHRSRPASVRGFTLLADEFHARRIHLLGDGQSSWYLAHELVHALIGPSWRALPGILEEGLGDVVAEALNPEYADHIRAHRLLNAASLSGGFDVGITYSVPDSRRVSRHWERHGSRLRVPPEESGEEDGGEAPSLRRLLATSRSDLHRAYPEIPESLYGFAWLVTSRIVERRGLAGLHALCLRAEREGHELVPAEWLERAAAMDLDALDPAFLGSCFGTRELAAAVYLQTDLFADVAIEALRPLQREYRRGTLRRMDPSFLLADGSELSFGLLRPLRYGIYVSWRDAGPRAVPASAPMDARGDARGDGRGNARGNGKGDGTRLHGSGELGG